MFTTLFASRPVRHPLVMSTWGSVSTGLHLGVLLGVVWLTGRATEPTRHAVERITYVTLPDDPAPTEEPEAPPIEEPAAEPPPAVLVVEEPPPLGFQELATPREIAPVISSASEVVIRAIDFRGVGVPGGVGDGVRPALSDSVPAPLAVASVDSPPRAINVRDLASRMRSLYPQAYRLAGIEGETVVQFVVDADGRVEDAGMTVVVSTHPEFHEATRELVKLLRFEPAQVNGRAVRVWIRMPVEWTIS